MDLDAEIDALYGLTPDAFVPARDALAKRARGGLGKEAGDRVKGLRRPVAAIWAVNQLWRRDVARFQLLLDTGDRVRAVQVARDRSREALGEALGAQRELVQELLEEAAAILEAGGFAVGPNLERVRANLAALSAWGTDVPVQPGRLDGDVEPPGFEVLLRVAPRTEAREAAPSMKARAKPAPLRLVEREPAPESNAAPKPKAPPSPSQADREAYGAAKKELARREKALDRATTQVETARQRLEEAEARTARAQEELARREAEEQQQRHALAEAAAARDHARRELREAQAAERDAAARLTR